MTITYLSCGAWMIGFCLMMEIKMLSGRTWKGYVYCTGGTKMPQSHTQQPPSMYYQNFIRGWFDSVMVLWLIFNPGTVLELIWSSPIDLIQSYWFDPVLLIWSRDSPGIDLIQSYWFDPVTVLGLIWSRNGSGIDLIQSYWFDPVTVLGLIWSSDSPEIDSIQGWSWDWFDPGMVLGLIWSSDSLEIDLILFFFFSLQNIFIIMI